MFGQGFDPIESKRRPNGSLFGDVADRFILERVEQFKNAAHRRAWRRSLTVYAKPIRHIPIAAITVEDVLKVLRPVWVTRWPTAKKLRIHLSQVLNFARALGLREGPNPATWADNLDAILPPRAHKEEHHPFMDWRDAPDFFAALGKREAVCARLIEFVMLTGCRSSEGRGLPFREIDRDERVWNLPASRAKDGKDHRFPLSDRALAIIEERAFIEGADSQLVFPSPRGLVFSDQAPTRLMERIGVTGVTTHGFRSTFSTWAHDATNHPHEIIEESLSHAVGTAVSRAYRRSDAVERRRALMDDWAAYLAPKKAHAGKK